MHLDFKKSVHVDAHAGAPTNQVTLPCIVQEIMRESKGKDLQAKRQERNPKVRQIQALRFKED